MRGIMRTLGIFVALVAASSFACSSNDKSGANTDTDSGLNGGDSTSGDTHFGLDSSPSDGLSGDITPNDSPSPGGTPIVYGNTDTDLWSLDPTTKTITKIGSFSVTDTMTDVAVDGDNNVWVNSETTLYAVTLPSGGTGTVTCTSKATFGTASKMYALGFVPKDVLTPGAEALVAGDITGALHYIDTSSGAVQDLGSFGNWKTGDPNPSGKSTTTDVWTLSGDVVFYIDPSGAPRGLATIRTCYTPAGSTTAKCYADNDALAEVDMAALKSNFDSKGTSASLRKNILGLSGSGRLFGLGAWEDTVYGFSRFYKGSTTLPPVPPELVTMGASGAGTVLQSFGTGAAPEFSNGWSGAGVTTKAKISVIK
jgi:hypothetical protein